MSHIEQKANGGRAAALGARLISTLERAGFFESAWEKERFFLQSYFQADELAEIFPLEQFDSVLMSGSLMSPHLDVVRGSKKLAASFRVSPSPATDVSQLLEELKNGATIRVAHIEHYIPALNSMCRALEAKLHLPLRANLYMTPPFSQGFAPHFDLDDIFVLQAFGQKDWYLHSKYSGQQPLPNNDMPFDAAKHKSEARPDIVRLSAGDVLYLPRGFMHEARTDSCASIHITFAAIGIKLGQMVEQLVKKLSVLEPGLRRMVRFDPASPPDSAELEALASEIRSCLAGLVEPEMLLAASNYLRESMANHRNPEHGGDLLRGLSEGFDAI